jgi:glutamate dehydrogenase/leucine dehydrogenase
VEPYELPDWFETEVLLEKDIKARTDIPHDEFGPVKFIRLYDGLRNKTWGYIFVHNLNRGPVAIGGTRLAKDLTLEEIYGLARAMSFKNAAAMLPVGGGKSGFIIDPEYMFAHPEEKKRLMERFAKALWSIPKYVPGPDMGTNETDMQVLYDNFTQFSGGKTNHGRGGIGRPKDKGGIPLDEWGLTAHGLFAAIKTAEKFEKDFKTEGSRVVVQGYGNVGSPIATKLRDAGALIVGASDIHVALYNENGLDVDQLNAIRTTPDALTNYEGEVTQKFGPDELDKLLEVSCDILVPAARPGVINGTNCDRISTRIMLQGANNPCTAKEETHLKKSKGITCMTDWIVNAGGVIAGAIEYCMDTDPEYRKKVLASDGTGRKYIEDRITRTVAQNVEEIYERIKSSNGELMFRDVARSIGYERLTDEKLRSQGWM